MPATACHGWTERFDQVVLTQADSGVQQLNRTDGQSQANDDPSSTPGRTRDNRPDGKRQGSTTSGGVLSGDLLAGEDRLYGVPHADGRAHRGDQQAQVCQWKPLGAISRFCAHDAGRSQPTAGESGEPPARS